MIYLPALLFFVYLLIKLDLDMRYYHKALRYTTIIDLTKGLAYFESPEMNRTIGQNFLVIINPMNWKMEHFYPVAAKWYKGE